MHFQQIWEAKIILLVLPSILYRENLNYCSEELETLHIKIDVIMPIRYRVAIINQTSSTLIVNQRLSKLDASFT